MAALALGIGGVLILTAAIVSLLVFMRHDTRRADRELDEAREWMRKYMPKSTRIIVWLDEDGKEI